MVFDFAWYRVNSLYIKPTTACNLRCSYCYCNRGSNHESTRVVRTMAPEVLERLIIEYITFVASNPAKHGRARFIWHGGEPSLIGREFFERVVRLQSVVNQGRIQVKNSIQTNGTLINDDWARFFRDADFSVGVSIDGPSEVNDEARILPNGSSSFEATWRGIERLQAHNIPFGALSVLTAKSVRHAATMYRFFRDIRSLAVVDFIPCFFFNNDEWGASPRALFEFWATVFDAWKSDRFCGINISFLGDLVRRCVTFYGGQPQQDRSTCELTGCCGRSPAVLPDGSVYPCECLVNVQELKLGNIMDQSLGEMLSGENWDRFQQLCNEISVDCVECKYFDVCRGGCLHRRLPGWTTSRNKDHYCQTRMLLIDYIARDIAREVTVADNSSFPNGH